MLIWYSSDSILFCLPLNFMMQNTLNIITIIITIIATAIYKIVLIVIPLLDFPSILLSVLLELLELFPVPLLLLPLLLPLLLLMTLLPPSLLKGFGLPLISLVYCISLSVQNGLPPVHFESFKLHKPVSLKLQDVNFGNVGIYPSKRVFSLISLY